MGVMIISLADTIGVSRPEQITSLFKQVSIAYPNIEFGVHLHSRTESVIEKIDAAYAAGCKRFDGALKGFGGCPMAKDELVGNIPTETVITYLSGKGENLSISEQQLDKALVMAGEVF